MSPTPNTDALFQAVKTDHELEAATERTSQDLARHRWHWILDPDNVHRVSAADYAVRIGRKVGIVAAMAQGYAASLTSGASLQEEIARARTNVENTAAYEAVAAATGKSFQNVRQNNTALAGRVKRIAQDRADHKGTTVAEELEKVAKIVVASEAASASAKVAKAATADNRMLTLEGHIATVILGLKHFLRDSREANLNEDQLAFLGSDIARAQALLNLCNLRITGTTPDIDWDAELVKMGEQA